MTNDVAVIIGATGGIGAEVARGLVGQGYEVIVAARDETRALTLVETLDGRARFRRPRPPSVESRGAHRGPRARRWPAAPPEHGPLIHQIEYIAKASTRLFQEDSGPRKRKAKKEQRTVPSSPRKVA